MRRKRRKGNTNLIQGYRTLPELNLLLSIIFLFLFLIEHTPTRTDTHATERSLASSQGKWC
jgi:hypothetical protein